MQVKVNTGNGVDNKDSLERWATDFLNDSLSRFAGDITRVEVQLTDESRARQNGADMRCMLEARMAGREPIAVNHHGANQDEAVRGATQRLVHALDHTFGKLDRQHRARDTIRRATDAPE
ncbi:MAG TPA: HPF/RaiA family ribosome-associated protein [Ramlibacter sp.]|nr:HPF/RaiA family ribosome-associated protein [Ramlibacter sp.]